MIGVRSTPVYRYAQVLQVGIGAPVPVPISGMPELLGNRHRRNKEGRVGGTDQCRGRCVSRRGAYQRYALGRVDHIVRNDLDGIPLALIVLETTRGIDLFGCQGRSVLRLNPKVSRRPGGVLESVQP